MTATSQTPGMAGCVWSRRPPSSPLSSCAGLRSHRGWAADPRELEAEEAQAGVPREREHADHELFERRLVEDMDPAVPSY